MVSIIKLARIGLEDTRRQPPPQEQEKKEQSPKPVYYIVEKKRTKRSYGTPREISFTDEKTK